MFDPRPLPSLFHGMVGWYRLRLRTPVTRDGFGWALRFEQSRRLTSVWLNGRFLGGHDDAYTPFQLDLGALRPGAQNTVVVRVDNRKGIEPREGWWNWGGLVRPVSLVPLGPVTVSDLGLMPDLTCSAPGVCGGRLVVDAMIANRSPRTVTPTLRLTLTPPAGSAAPAPTSMLAPGTMRPGDRAAVRFYVPLDGPLELLVPDRPRLYRATVQTLADGQPTQTDGLDIGMRRVENRGGLLYLNGHQIELRGASIEEDVPGRGPALTPADQRQIVTELQQLHANVTRSQYPLSEPLLDLLDRAGILVWTEAPIYHRDDLLHTPAQRAAALATLTGSVIATRNHPSVLTQSIANELTPTPDTVPGTKAYIDAAVPLVRQLDPAVPVSIDVLSYPNFPSQRTYQQFDLLGISNYYGWYLGKAGHSTASIAGLGPFMRLTHARYPAQALVMSEFGAEATLVGPADQKQSYAFQTRLRGGDARRGGDAAVPQRSDLLDAARVRGQAELGWRPAAHGHPPHVDPPQGPDQLLGSAEAGVRGGRPALRADTALPGDRPADRRSRAARRRAAAQRRRPRPARPGGPGRAGQRGRPVGPHAPAHAGGEGTPAPRHALSSARPGPRSVSGRRRAGWRASSRRCPARAGCRCRRRSRSPGAGRWRCRRSRPRPRR